MKWRPEPLSFYAKAYVLQQHAQQQGEISPPLKSAFESPMMPTTYRDDIQRLLYCFSLLISRARSSKRKTNLSPAGEIAACVLRERPLTEEDRDAKEYILYAAKNSGFSLEDREYMDSIENWMNSMPPEGSGPRHEETNVQHERDHDFKGQLDDLALTYLKPRIQSNLDSMVDMNQLSTRTVQRYSKMKSPITIEEELLEILRGLSESSSSDFKERYEELRQAAIFVRQNRKHFGLWNAQEGDLMMIAWKKVESATRVPIAVDFLDSFRKGLADTGSTFRIEFVESKKRLLFSEGIATRQIKVKVRDMAKTLSRESRQVLCLNNSLFPQARGNMKVPKTVHCEIQLLEYLLDTLGEPVLKEFYDYIGCSKAPCWLCDFLVRHATGFKMSDSHAGVYTNWVLPAKLVEMSAIDSALGAIYQKMSAIMRQAE